MELRQVVFYSPGPKWKSGANFRDQQEDIVVEHVQYYSRCHNQGKLNQGGPYLDLDSGGMMIAAEGVSREELEEYARADPAILAGLLVFELKTWYVAMSG